MPIDRPHRPTVVALLPIKAHSERVPGKNFRSFAGRPLFRWILDTLLSLDLVDRVVINTDGQELLREHGLIESDRVVVRSRAEAICGDHVSMNAVLANDVAAVPADAYVMTHATNPLLRAGTIQRAWDAFIEGQRQGHDSLFTVNRVQTRFYREDGSAVNHDPDRLLRTQDLEPWYEENSNLYIFTRESFAATHARIGRRPILFPTPQVESTDIDDATGWHLAEIFALATLISDSTQQYRQQAVAAPSASQDKAA